MTAVNRYLASPRFLVACLLLVAAAVAMRPAIAALTTRFLKEPIAPRTPLAEFRIDHLPTFRPAREGHGLRQAPDDPEADDMLWHALECDRAGADDPGYAALFVTYYSDPRDTIPHTPDVCYAQAGASINALWTIDLPTPGLPATPSVPAKVVDLSKDGVRAAVIYVLYSNGSAYAERQLARFAIGLPGDRHVYFSKAEVIVPCRRGIEFEEAQSIGSRLLAESLAELVGEHFPRPEDLR